MIAPGLVSITFRKLVPREIVALVRRAGLAGIEWGGDIHAPHGDLARAREVRALMTDAGLTTYAYGSYYRAGHSECEGLAFTAVRDSAAELGAPCIRVWAGKQNAEDADVAYRQAVVTDLRRIAGIAAQAGQTIGLEFHGGTLTNTAAACHQLLAEVDHPAVFTFWQPPVGLEPAACVAGLRLVLPRVRHLHVFHWREGFNDRRPLAEGAESWRQYFEVARTAPGDRFAALEYVRDDDPRGFLADAATLRAWLGE